MFSTFVATLDWVGLVIFVVSGALVAARKEMDIVGFILLGTVTGIGGGTIRDMLLGALPVFWVAHPAYLLVCVATAGATFFLAHIPQSRYRLLLWFDAAGMALFAVTGAEKALAVGSGPVAAVAMGMITGTFGGIIRDILGGESPALLRREIYVSAAFLAAMVFVLATGLGAPSQVAMIAGFVAGASLRFAALHWNWTLPRYRSRPGE